MRAVWSVLMVMAISWKALAQPDPPETPELNTEGEDYETNTEGLNGGDEGNGVAATPPPPTRSPPAPKRGGGPHSRPIPDSQAGTNPPPPAGGQLIVFGDGFTDNGIDIANKDIHGLYPASNGPVWSDYLAQNMFGNDCKKKNWRENLQNFAYDGAESGWDNKYFGSWSGLLWQIDRYTCRYTHNMPADTTIVIQMVGHSEIEKDRNYVPRSIVENLKSGIHALLKRGAKKIIVLGLIDPAKIPAYQSYNDRWGTNLFSTNVRNLNQEVLYMIEQNTCKKDEKPEDDNCYQGVFFTNNIFDALEKKFQIKNTTLQNEIINRASSLTTRGRYNQFDQYLWYDSSHLTTAAHKELAKRIKKGIDNIGKDVTPAPARKEEERPSAESIRLSFGRAKLARDDPATPELKAGAGAGLGYEGRDLAQISRNPAKRQELIRFLESPSSSEAERRRKERILRLVRRVYGS